MNANKCLYIYALHMIMIIFFYRLSGTAGYISIFVSKPFDLDATHSILAHAMREMC